MRPICKVVALCWLPSQCRFLPRMLNTSGRRLGCPHPAALLREPIVLHFRKSFSLAAIPAKFPVHVSADNRFVLYVNGERVGDGPDGEI